MEELLLLAENTLTNSMNIVSAGLACLETQPATELSEQPRVNGLAQVSNGNNLALVRFELVFF